MTSQHKRLCAYLLVAFALLMTFAGTSPVWATPGSSHANQTVPTPTPQGSGQPPIPVVPTAEPAPTAPPVFPMPTEVGPAPAPSPQPELKLELRADTVSVWQGVVIRYTVTLSNAGQVSARDVRVSVTLPEGLSPIVADTSAGSVWSGQVLSLAQPVLAPNGRLNLTLAAVVQPTARLGSILVTGARTDAAGLASLMVSHAAVMPPAQLPPVGGVVGRAGCLSR